MGQHLNKIRKVLPLFSTPVFETEIFLNDKIKLFIEKQKRKIIEPAKNGLVSNDNYILNNKKLKIIKKDILNEINFYKNNVLQVKDNIKCYIKNSWLVFHNANDFSHNHYHLNSFISGILYIKTPKDCGNIVFHSSKMNHSIFPLINIPFKKYNEYNSLIFNFQIKENQLLLFPSSLIHSVEKNLSNDTRICLAFNVLIKGDLSDSEISHFSL